MAAYFHSVTLEKEKCMGCTNCIKRCPTEAIRVREGKAKIIDERCIDCGECIRVCHNHAKRALTDPLEIIKAYPYPVALPAPTLYSQFSHKFKVDQIIQGLLNLGFFRVWEVARGAEIATQVLVKYLENHALPKPVISAACPAVLRLIQVRYPELLEHVIPIESPMEISARLAKKELEEEGYPVEQVGVFFISPCAAKVTSVKNPLGVKKSQVDGVIAISDIYGPLLAQLASTACVSIQPRASGAGIGWAVTGGESRLLPFTQTLSVDGIANVVRVLDDIAMGKLKEVDFIEGLACMGGCVGGPLTIENSYLSKTRIQNLSKKYGMSYLEVAPEFAFSEFFWTEKIEPCSVLVLDEDLALAMQKLETLDEIHKALPGLDCGSCGAPTCRALAEDIVRGLAVEIDCIFKLREKVTDLAERMVELSSKLPPSIGKPR
jgi:iron only hydrogenase large subunit-like protein